MHRLVLLIGSLWYQENKLFDAMIDLHIHTTYSSDGQHTPEEILRMAQDLGLTALAFADHMEIGAVHEGLRRAQNYALEFFPGLEFSTQHAQQEFHLLYYGFDPEDSALYEFLHRYCTIIWDQATEIIDHFTGMGFDLERADIDNWGRSIPTGFTFLNGLKKRNLKDARLHDYIAGRKSGSPYLNFYKDFLLADLGEGVREMLPALTETIAHFHSRGVLILAHPGYIERPLLQDLREHGLDGIEVYSTYHDKETVTYLTELARDLALLISAGSDYHGELIKPGISIGDVQGEPSASLLNALRKK
jgi:predicted metal-dependent phosphoesterase TrpH